MHMHAQICAGVDIMSSIRVPIKPETLAWALKRARLKPSGLAKSCGVSEEKVAAWLGGHVQPTYKQARKAAERLRVSLGQLLLPPPEKEDLPLPDFRRGTLDRDQPSPDLIETIYDALRKRDWWREYQGGRKLPFVGSVNWKDSTPQEVAEQIRRHIPFQALARQANSAESYLRVMTDHAERVGILVLRKGVVGNNTHRPLDPTEFSGFAIADPVAPIIVINMRDYPRRRNFTFAHELAHVWVGQSAVDDNLELQSEEELERFCDRVAAELLVPKEEFQQGWRGKPLEAAETAARRFWVSVWVAARRAFNLELITWDEYQEVIASYYSNLSKMQDSERKTSGGDSRRNILDRHSPTFVRAVAESVKNSELTYKEAASLLSLSIRTVIDFLESQDDEVSS